MQIFKNKILITGLLLIAILAFAFYLRSNTFWLAHWTGDQEHYIALAMKLDNFGLEGYNLRGVDVKVGLIDLAVVKGQVLKGVIGQLVPSPGPGKGYLLNVLIDNGVEHYDQPLHHVGPAFAYMLMLSNKIFSKDGKYTSVNQNVGRLVKFLKPKLFFDAQFYAVILPLIFSLLLILVIFFLGKNLFSAEAGLIAAFIQSANTLDLLSSQKVWADEMAVFFTTLAVLIFVKAVRNKKLFLFILSALSCSVAGLTRQNTLVIVFVLIGYYLFDLVRQKAALSLKNLSNLILFFVVVVAGVFFWFWKMYQTYGNIFFMPSIEMTTMTDMTQWYDWIEERPHSVILYSVGLVAISPIFIFAFAAIKDYIKAIKNAFKKALTEHDAGIFLLFSWFLVFFISFAVVYHGKEHRYLLPTYPALAILSACYLLKLKNYLAGLIKVRPVIFSYLIIFIILVAYAGWGIYNGNDLVLSDKSLIFIPF